VAAFFLPVIGRSMLPSVQSDLRLLLYQLVYTQVPSVWYVTKTSLPSISLFVI